MNHSAAGAPSEAEGWKDRLVQKFDDRHRRPFNIVCHLVGMPVIAAGLLLILFRARFAAGLLCVGGGFTVTGIGHSTERTLPAVATSGWYSALGAPFWWARHLRSLARTGRLWDGAMTSNPGGSRTDPPSS